MTTKPPISMLDASAGVGYQTGSGGAVTQTSSKSTNITLDKPVGRITLANSALAAGATVTFALSNTFIAAEDLILLTIVRGSTFNVAYYNVWADASAGSAVICIKNVHTASLSEAVQINYAVIKGAIA